MNQKMSPNFKRSTRASHQPKTKRWIDSHGGETNKKTNKKNPNQGGLISWEYQ